MTTTNQQARHMAQSLARSSYGRLLAIIAARTGDVAAAEDALVEAFTKALIDWPKKGVPGNPEAWLVVTARREIGHAHRHQDVRNRSEQALKILHEGTQSGETDSLPDERLKLLFACAHPAIAPNIRTPLMLQTVLGLDAERIGKAFLVSATTMGQRLVRAKSKIKAAGVPFTVPDRQQLPERLQDMLNAIYAAFNTGWDDLPHLTNDEENLAEEAIYLARLVVALLPGEPEALGLLALMLHSEARRDARRTKTRNFVPLSDQDPALWNKSLIDQAEACLNEAASYRAPSRYQTEAAIQSMHAARVYHQIVDPKLLVQLYDLLVQQTPSLGAAVSRAAAYLAADQALAADQLLSAMSGPKTAEYQPYWVARANVSAALGDHNQAQSAFSKAIALTPDPSVKRYLEDRTREAIASHAPQLSSR